MWPLIDHYRGGVSVDNSMSLLRVALEDACGHDGCPLCYVLNSREQDWLEIFLRERGADPGMGRLMRDSLGLCLRHAGVIAEQADLEGPLALVFVYDDLLDDLQGGRRVARSPLSRQSDRGRRLYQRLSEVTPGDRCPACVARRHSEDALAGECARAMAGSRFAVLYDQSAGLCDAHLRYVLRGAAPAVQLHLLNTQMARLAGVLPGLQRVERESDFRDTEALRRAVILLVGPNGYGCEGERPRSLSGVDTGACVLCAAEHQALKAYMSGLLRGKQTCTSEPVWLCAQHAWQFDYTARKSGAARVYRSWLTAAVASVASEYWECADEVHAAMVARPTAIRWLRRQQAFAVPAPRQCSACMAMSAAANERATRLAEYVVCADVCLRHASLVAHTLPERPREILCEHLVVKMAQVHHELDEYIRARSWQPGLEQKTVSRDSWQRAVELFVGHRGRTQAEVLNQ